MKILALIAALLLVGGCSSILELGGAVAARPAQLGAQVPDYDRDEFGDGWADVDGDCQDTRNEILIRDLVDERLDDEGCKVLTGTLHGPYTGATIEFRRGQDTSSDVQIDHVIPLSYAWQAGAWQWTGAEREAFSNDPANLRAVDGPTNNSKGDRGPAPWVPPNPAAHCDYATAWRRDVASAYALVLDEPDAARVEEILSAC